MNFFWGRTAGRKTASHFSWPMLPVIIAAALLLTACGVKNDLVRPNGQATTRDQTDPSRPPGPLGR